MRPKHSRKQISNKEKPDSEISKQIIMESFDYYPGLGRLRTRLQDSPTESMSLKDAASIAGMERTHFSKFFHSKTGVKFKDWLDFLRIEYAVSLFQKSNESVTDVAFKSGFDDLTTFGRTFRRVKGMSPKEFKRLCKPDLIRDPTQR